MIGLEVGFRYSILHNINYSAIFMLKYIEKVRILKIKTSLINKSSYLHKKQLYLQ